MALMIFGTWGVISFKLLLYHIFKYHEDRQPYMSNEEFDAMIQRANPTLYKQWKEQKQQNGKI